VALELAAETVVVTVVELLAAVASIVVLARVADELCAPTVDAVALTVTAIDA
jgi:hypothetical protein